MLQTAQKGQYLILRNVGELKVKALRLCNYSEFYSDSRKECTPCISSSSGSSYPLTINAPNDTACYKCEDILAGKLVVPVDVETLGRITYLCNN